MDGRGLELLALTGEFFFFFFPAGFGLTVLVMADLCRVLESIKAGTRLAESRFAVLSVAPKGQRSAANMFGAR